MTFWNAILILVAFQVWWLGAMAYTLVAWTDTSSRFWHAVGSVFWVVAFPMWALGRRRR